MTPRVSVVVPTLGRVPGLAETLRAMRRERGVETVVVSQGPEPPPELPGAVDLALHLPAPAGFAVAANRGIEEARGEEVLLLNDDARLAPPALDRLVTALDEQASLAAVQPAIYGPNGRVDSLGIGWNRWWQAVQRSHGRSRPESVPEGGAVFGAHAAVALFRRCALEEVALDGRVFDEVLDTYYEDVELAGRLRARGWEIRVVPQAEAEHAGGASAGALGTRRRMLLCRNRLLVLARFFGAELGAQLPRILARDVLDGLRSPGRWPAILGGWRRARRAAPAFAARGGYRVSPASLRRYREG